MSASNRDALASARESLIVSEERFRLFVEQVVDYALFVLDPDGHVASWNAGAERIKGYQASEILGQHLSKFYRPEDQWKCAVELETAAREGRAEDEGWRVRKDGSLFWANVVLTALRAPDGTLVGYAKVTRDLTERRRAEEALRKETSAREGAERVLTLLTRLHAIAGLLAAANVPQQVAEIIVREGANALRARGGVFVAPRQGALEVVAANGVDGALLEAWRRFVPDDSTPIGRAYQTATSQWSEGERDLTKFTGTPSSRMAAAAALPLVAGGAVIGVIGLAFDAPQIFPPDERALVEAMATHAAQAFERSRRFEAERAAQALAEKLRASLSITLRSIGDAVITTDRSGMVTMMNPEAERLTGYAERDAAGRPLSEVFRIVNEITNEPVTSPVDKVLESGVVVGLANHTVLVSRDGRRTPIDDSGAPIRAEGATTIEGVVLVFRDVTDKKHEQSRRAFMADATSALAESLDYQVTVAKVAHLAVPQWADWCAVDIVEPNDTRPRRLAVAHVDPEKVKLAQEIQNKYPPNMDASTGVPNVLRTGRAELYREIPDELLAASAIDEEHLRLARALKLRSAMIVPLIARERVLGAISFVFAESGRTYSDDDLRFCEELARRCATAIDNARLYASEQTARRAADMASRAKDEFLAVVSHELRTPLNAIMGWAKMMSAAPLDEARRTRALVTIERNAVAMAQLIEDLLDMSRIISGKMRLEVQPVELVRVIDAAIESMRPAADAKDIELVADISPSLPTVTGDPTRLQQIVWNLMSNAVKFTERGGKVDVSLTEIGSSVAIAVTDTGKGIAPQFLPHVFDAFRQEDASHTRSHGGLGLGLAITRELVELHGGQIEATSEGEGKGATFRVVLPISAHARASGEGRFTPRPQRRPASSERPPQLHGLRVLVVDDEPDARELVEAVLEDCGCRVTQASTVDEAVAAFEPEPPDVLVSDIGMPGQDGYELIRRVRSLPPERGGTVPAAALTAYARAEDRRRLLTAGYSMHVPKPVEPAELIAVVVSLTRFMQRREET